MIFGINSPQSKNAHSVDNGVHEYGGKEAVRLGIGPAQAKPCRNVCHKADGQHIPGIQADISRNMDKAENNGGNEIPQYLGFLVQAAEEQTAEAAEIAFEGKEEA
jgi:hypothetical protein